MTTTGIARSRMFDGLREVEGDELRLGWSILSLPNL